MGKKKIVRPPYRGTSAQRLIARFERNGITREDLDKEFDAGFEAGRKAAHSFAIPMCYAAAALALRNLCTGKSRFGRDRIIKFLELMDDQVCDHLTSQEAIDDVWKEIGIRMDFNSPKTEIDLIDGGGGT